MSSFFGRGGGGGGDFAIHNVGQTNIIMVYVLWSALVHLFPSFFFFFSLFLFFFVIFVNIFWVFL